MLSKKALTAGVLVQICGVFFSQGCQPMPAPVPPVNPDADAAPVADADASPSDGMPIEAMPPDPNDGSRCALDYHRIVTDMGCAQPVSPSTGSWTLACENATANGVDFHLKCIEQATSCSIVSDCLKK